MDAITLLTKDHREFDTLFKRFQRLGDREPDTRRAIVDSVIRGLARHALVEEQFLYPAVRERAKKASDEELALEALEEHHVVKWLLFELDKMRPEDERFNAKVKVLIDLVRRHVEEEEGQMFPLLRRLYSNQELEDLGAMMEEAKKIAPTHPHPRAPDTPPGNFLAGAISGLLDRGRDLVGELRAPRSASARQARTRRAAPKRKKK